MSADNNKRICIIGCGASGSICAYFLSKYFKNITIFDLGSPLRTILPTGGGRCNLAHEEFDINELVKNYPRGEKFLYSVFSQFSTYDTLSLFDELGIKTYTQQNGRIFPTTDSSKDVRFAILKNIKKVPFKQEKVLEISKSLNGYRVKTNKSLEEFSHIVIAIGGHWGYSLLKNLDIKIVPPKPSLVGLKTAENFGGISGVVINSVKSNEFDFFDSILFTHYGISGPLVFKISSLNARKDFPYSLSFDLYNSEYDLQNELNINPHKDIKNILSVILPKNFVKFFLNYLNIDENLKAHKINGITRDLILSNLHNFNVKVNGTDKGEETVTSGGVDLNEVIPRTLMSKKYKNLYFCGEVLDIDGFCGGFNLQNAWSTGYVVSRSILNFD